MKYTFPIINRIEDVLPHIAGREEFVVLEKEGYTIIDYVLQSNETFPNPMITGEGFTTELLGAKILRECRGIAFDTEGKIISRPFQKFFNYGEKPTEQTDIGLPSEVLEKLDGSMIRPLIIGGDIRLATRKGITDVAMQAEEFAAGKDNYIDLISSMSNSGYTPIFEWCSRLNQVVLDYPEPKLVLIAIRHTITGEYKTYEQVKVIADTFNVPVVESYTTKDEPLEKTVERVRNLKDKEGHVMVWPNGHRMKAKAEWYVTLHRAKEAIGREKDLIKVYLTTGLDDILPILPENYRKEVAHYLAKLTEELVTTCRRLDGMFTRIVEKMPESFSRKQFALEVQKMDPRYKHYMFALLPGTPCMEIVIANLLKSCQSKTVLDEHRWLIGGIRYGEKEVEAA